MSQQSKYKLPVLAGALLLTLGGGIGLGLYFGGRDRPDPPANRGLPAASPAEIQQIKSIPKPKPPVRFEQDDPDADTRALPATPPINALRGLNDPEGSIEKDLAIIDHLLAEALTVFHSLPTGTDEEIVSFLSGQNPRGIAYFPPDNPNLDEAGQIKDRWGTPFAFHVISHTHIEVRSAGPDTEHWTDDDIVRNKSDDRLTRELSIQNVITASP